MAVGSTSPPSPRRIHLLGPAATPQALERLERRRRVVGAGCRTDVPRTNNGKKVEMACMNLLRGRPVANRGSIANAGVVDFYEALAPHLEKLLPQGGR